MPPASFKIHLDVQIKGVAERTVLAQEVMKFIRNFSDGTCSRAKQLVKVLDPCESMPDRVKGNSARSEATTNNLTE